MADDIQLQVGIDLDALKASAEKAAEVIGKAMQGAMGSTIAQLGGGGPKAAAFGATAGMAPQGSVSLDDLQQTLQQILQAIGGLNQTTQQQTNQQATIAQQTTAAGGPPGQQAKAGFFTGMRTMLGLSENPQKGPHFGMKTGPALGMLSRLGAMGQSAGALTNEMIDALNRGTTTGYLGVAADAVGKIPGMGGWQSAIKSLQAQSDKTDTARDLRYEIWRTSGESAARGFTTQFGYKDLEQQMIDLGITPQRYMEMQRSVGRGYGATNPGGALLGMDTQYNLFDESVGALSAFRRSGGLRGANMSGAPGQTQQSGASDTQILGESIGIAVATNLERGRWGESVQNMTRAAQSVMHGNVDLQRVVSTQTFIGRMGQQYMGDTAQANAMQQGMLNLASGAGGGFERAMAMKAYREAHPGATYFDVEMGLEEGAFAGGVSVDQIITQYSRPGMPIYDAVHGKLPVNTAAGIMARIAKSLTKTQWRDLILTLKAGIDPSQSLPPEVLDRIQKQLIDTGALPKDWLEKRKGEARARIADLHAVMKDANEEQQSINPSVQGGAGLQKNAPYGPGSTFNTGSVLDKGGQYPSGSVFNQQSSFQSSSETATPGPASAESYRGSIMSGSGPRMTSRGMEDHHGVDLPLKPGSDVLSPVNGTIAWMAQHATGIEIGGSIHILEDKTNLTIRLYHIDPTTIPRTLKVGMRVVKGTFLGCTYKKDFTGSKSHLHVGLSHGGGKKADYLKPESRPDLLNSTTEATGGVRVDASGNPMSSSPGPVTSPSQVEGPSSFQQPSIMYQPPQQSHVTVSVQDHRVSITKVAAKSRRGNTRIG